MKLKENNTPVLEACDLNPTLYCQKAEALVGMEFQTAFSPFLSARRTLSVKWISLSCQHVVWLNAHSVASG